MIKPNSNLPAQIRVSLGTAMLLGLLKGGKMEVLPTTAYLMTYTEGKCTANCSFCSQARDSKSRADLLSRVTWPSFPTFTVIAALDAVVREGKIRRVCIQALNVPGVFLHLEALVREIKKKHVHEDVCVSVSCQPLNSQDIVLLKDAGVDRVGIALDAVTETVFCKVKGVAAGGFYSWRHELGLLEEAVGIFGAGKVSTHLIVGLGEVERDVVGLIQWCVDRGVLPALFAFTPIQGTVLEHGSQPSVVSYRRLQLARYLLVQGVSRLECVGFDVGGEIVSFGVGLDVLEGIVNGGVPFQTSGCLDCNRPFYNEKLGGPVYNYPRSLSVEEVGEVKKLLGLYFRRV
ncbi:MAG: radical SAM protein [Candidatus Bathyarchaeota archaeon]|nr:radical SAM protein [Candidatus Termiticorpusculum sp.]